MIVLCFKHYYLIYKTFLKFLKTTLICSLCLHFVLWHSSFFHLRMTNQLQSPLDQVLSYKTKKNSLNFARLCLSSFVNWTTVLSVVLLVFSEHVDFPFPVSFKSYLHILLPSLLSVTCLENFRINPHSGENKPVAIRTRSSI